MRVFAIAVVVSCIGCGERESASSSAIKVQTANLPEITKVELCLLGESPLKDAGEIDIDVTEVSVPKQDQSTQDLESEFLVRAMDSSVLILKRKMIDGTDAKKIAKLWRNCEFGEEFANCHFPHYGLRFYANEELKFETSICWGCRNFVLNDGNEHIFWGFNDPNDELLSYLENILPPSKNDSKK